MRLRRRGRPTSPSTGPRIFGSAVVLGTLALVSPLDAVGEEYLLSAHMLQHVIIGDMAPALTLVAVRGPLLFFLLPSPACACSRDAGRSGAILRRSSAGRSSPRASGRS